MSPTTTFLKISNDSVIPIRVFVNRRSIAHSLSLPSDLSQEGNNEGSDVFFQTVVPLSQSSKSMIRLKRSTKIRLSNNDLNRIVTVFQDTLKDLFFKLSYEEVESMSILSKQYQKKKLAAGKQRTLTGEEITDDDYYVQNSSSLKQTKDRYIIPLSKEGWRIHVILDKIQIEQIRMGRYGHPLRSDYHYGNYTKLLIKRTEFVFPVKKEKVAPRSEGLFVNEEMSDSEILAALQDREQSNETTDMETDEPGETKKAKSVLKYGGLSIIGRGVNVYVLKRP